MRLPVITGNIKRRLLVNFRADPAVVQALLPEPFRPKLHKGHAIVGICLIRLEEIRPAGFSALPGLASENAAHRIAVTWGDETGEHEGVFIPRRDTGSLMNSLAGGRLFPGEHHRAEFHVKDDGKRVELEMKSKDELVSIRVSGDATDNLPPTSCFDSPAEASAFFEGGCVGYSVTSDACRLDGVSLKIEHWRATPLQITDLYSSYFADKKLFPAGTVGFDHALVMRNIPHEWHEVPDLHLPAIAGR